MQTAQWWCSYGNRKSTSDWMKADVFSGTFFNLWQHRKQQGQRPRPVMGAELDTDCSVLRGDDSSSDPLVFTGCLLHLLRNISHMHSEAWQAVSHG